MLGQIAGLIDSLFANHLLITYYMPNTALGTWGTSVKKTEKQLFFHRVYIFAVDKTNTENK